MTDREYRKICEKLAIYDAEVRLKGLAAEWIRDIEAMAGEDLSLSLKQGIHLPPICRVSGELSKKICQALKQVFEVEIIHINKRIDQIHCCGTRLPNGEMFTE